MVCLELKYPHAANKILLWKNTEYFFLYIEMFIFYLFLIS